MWPFLSAAKSIVVGLVIGGEGKVEFQDKREDCGHASPHHTHGLPNMKTGSLNGWCTRPVCCSWL